MKARIVSSVPPWNGRQGEGIAHEAADRLDLGGDHGHDLALRDAPEMGQREAQDAREEVVAQAAQHALPTIPCRR